MTKSYLPLILSHLESLAVHGTDRYGEIHTPMFMATLDPITLSYPEDDTRPEDYKQRAYRLIHAPRGSSAYWDQPMLSAIYTLAEKTEIPSLVAAADLYLDY